MNLPESFIQQLQELVPDEWEALVDAISTTEPSVAVRVNDARGATVPTGPVKCPGATKASI